MNSWPEIKAQFFGCHRRALGAGARPALGDWHLEEVPSPGPRWQSVCARPVSELTGLSFVCVPGQQPAEADQGGVQPETGQVHGGRWPAGSGEPLVPLGTSVES